MPDTDLEPNYNLIRLLIPDRDEPFIFSEEEIDSVFYMLATRHTDIDVLQIRTAYELLVALIKELKLGATSVKQNSLSVKLGVDGDKLIDLLNAARQDLENKLTDMDEDTPFSGFRYPPEVESDRYRSTQNQEPFYSDKL